MRGTHRARVLARRANGYLARTRERARRVTSRLVDPRASRTHILISGYPRTGSSLLYNMLGACLADFEFDTAEIPATQTIWHWSNHVSKRPFDLFGLDEIMDANTLGKRVIMILTVRDLRDIMTSVHSYAPDDYLIGYESCHVFRGEFPRYTTTTTGPGLRDFFEAFQRCRAREDMEILTVRYEDLVSDVGALQAELQREFGLRFTLPFEEYHRRPDRHVIRFEGNRRPLAPDLVKFHDPVSHAYVGRWNAAEHRPRIAQQFGDHPELFEMLRAHGYEEDDTWFDAYRKEACGR